MKSKVKLSKAEVSDACLNNSRKLGLLAFILLCIYLAVYICPFFYFYTDQSDLHRRKINCKNSYNIYNKFAAIVHHNSLPPIRDFNPIMLILR